MQSKACQLQKQEAVSGVTREVVMGIKFCLETLPSLPGEYTWQELLHQSISDTAGTVIMA